MSEDRCRYAGISVQSYSVVTIRSGGKEGGDSFLPEGLCVASWPNWPLGWDVHRGTAVPPRSESVGCVPERYLYKPDGGRGVRISLKNHKLGRGS